MRALRFGVWGLGLLAAGCQGEPELIRVEGSGFFAPARLEYGTRALGDAHELITTFRNGTQDALRVQDVRFEPPREVYVAFLTEGGTLRGATLRPGQSVQITLVYRPLEEGDYDATLVVEANDLEIPLPITARARRVAPARPAVEPSQVRFLGSEVGRDVHQRVRITNVGDTDGQLQAVRSQTPFSVTAVGGGPLALPSARLAPGASLDVEVHYLPGAAGPRSDRLRFTFDTGEVATLEVFGDAVDAGVLTCDALALDFGSIPRGQSARRAVRCVADGGPYAIDALRLADGSSSQFSMAPEQPVLVEGTLAFDVVFDARGVPGRYDAAVEIRPLHDVVTRISATAEILPPSPGEAALDVELIWNTGDSDFDLHLVRSGGRLFEVGMDCYFEDKNPDWGVLGDPIDDPLLTTDDRNGFGPETVSLVEAREPIYDLWVHYYGFTHDIAPSTSLQLTYRMRGQAPQVLTRDLSDCGAAWHVGRFRYDVDPPRFEPRGDVVMDYAPRASPECAP